MTAISSSQSRCSAIGARLLSATLLLPSLALIGCGTEPSEEQGDEQGETEETGEGEPARTIPILGDGTHDINELEVTILSSEADGLNFPTDCEFKPGTNDLWTTNRQDFSVVVYQDVGTDSQLAIKIRDPIENGIHFLAKPAALAFGQEGTFATAQQEDGVTQPGDPPDGSFMGPTLWTSNLDDFTGGHWGHLDMLHNSPLSSGIAWESENTYWVFDGRHGSLTRYKFNEDHGLGGTDHTDGEIYRYVDGQLGYENSIPSHVVLHFESSMVYAADTANSRIVRLDPSTATMGNNINPNYDGGIVRYMPGGTLDTIVDGTTLEPAMMKPSGLELVDDILFVSDPITGIVYGFDLEGNLIDWLETGLPPGSLMGMAFDDEGSMYIVDAANNQLRKFALRD